MLSRFSPILIVDDSVTMRKVLRRMLNGMGSLNVHEAGNGLDALSMLHARRYALVISDWNMQPMNGIELLGKVRESSAICDMPFIIMTAYAVKFAAVARENGRVHYLIKPFEAEDLAAKIASATCGVAA